MFEILTLNDANPTVGRPFRIEDLQNIWSALAGVLSIGATTPKIVSGFNYEDALLDPTRPVGDGVIAYDGTLYVYDSVLSPIKLGDNLVLTRDVVTNDVRQLADGTIQTFSRKNVAEATGRGVDFGTLTTQKINQWKTAYIAARSVSGTQIGLRTVTRENLAQPFASVVSSMQSKVLPANPSIDNFVSWDGSNWVIDYIKVDAGTTLSLTSDNYDLLPDTLTVRVAPPDTALTLTTLSTRGITQSIPLSAGRGVIMTLHKSEGGFVVSSTMPFIP